MSWHHQLCDLSNPLIAFQLEGKAKLYLSFKWQRDKSIHDWSAVCLRFCWLFTFFRFAGIFARLQRSARPNWQQADAVVCRQGELGASELCLLVRILFLCICINRFEKLTQIHRYRNNTVLNYSPNFKIEDILSPNEEPLVSRLSVENAKRYGDFCLKSELFQNLTLLILLQVAQWKLYLRPIKREARLGSGSRYWW